MTTTMAEQFLVTYSVALNIDLPAWYAGTIVADELWRQPTTLRYDLGPMLWDGTHAQHCFSGHMPWAQKKIKYYCSAKEIQ